MQKQRIYQERDRLNTVRTVAAIIRRHDDEVASSRQNEASPLTTPTLQAGQIRGVTQASIDNISQAMNRRHAVGAYYTTAISNNISSYSNSLSYNSGKYWAGPAELNLTLMLIHVELIMLQG
jgi:hypothetical protein